MKIGFFDSGIGGLSVLHHALKVLPQEEFLYYADEKHVPYGEKTKKEIMEYVDGAMAFMVERGVKAVVLACNTATSVAVRELRKNYSIPIIGMEPAVKKAVDTYGDRRVFVMATPVTIRGDKMRYLLENVGKRHLVDLIPMPMLVRFAEQGIFQGPEVEEYVGKQLSGYDFREYSSLVLGCTHFNYFKDTFRKILPGTIQFVDGNEGTVCQLIRKLSETKQFEENTQSIEFYSSGEKLEGAELVLMKTLLKRLDEVYEL